ncbi:amino acid ABC transporter permease [Stenoxybacter acetivorans]|uniref:amino acid ABC transporter permease n=1 Tax=Stenoxybacter acetivorans TaxID=422441 RepID=UPI0005615F27|nr:amino acid ABC transporter permease [Stenoxybacter acetivorans]
MNYTWNWGVLLDPTGVGNQIYLQWLLSGIGWLLLIGGLAWVIALILGTALGIMRTLPSPSARRFATGYVTLFRNIPLLVQLFFWYYVVPNYWSEGLRQWWYYDLSPNTSALISAAIGLGLFTAARVCEQVRTGVEALPRGQAQAARALGFSAADVYRTVLLPQAFRIILPPLTSELTNCFKNASIASLVGVAELVSQTKTISEYSQSTFEIYTYATLVYIVINMALFALMAYLERRYRVPGLMNAKG